MSKHHAAKIHLIVEDVEETRDLIEQLLEADGYCVQPSRSEKDAVERARRESPNLILMSLDGHHVDVIETAVRMRRSAQFE